MTALTEIEIVETEQFRLDCALYEVPEDRLVQLRDRLVFNPVAGVQRPASPMLWDMGLAGLRVSYALSDDIGRVVLLRVVPQEAPPSRALPRLMALVGVINQIKRLFGF